LIGYILILLVILFGGIGSQKIQESPKKKKVFLFVVFGIMICFAVLRNYSVGIDYSNRVESMQRIFQFNFSDLRYYMEYVVQDEYLYTFFIWMVSRIFPSPWLVNAVMDIFVLSTFGCFFYRYSKDVTIASLMFAAFAFSAEMNITRQYVAAAFFLIALHFLIQKKPIKALLPLIAATLIHTSAVILFAIYIVYIIGFSVSRKKLFLLLAVAVGGFFAFEFILEWFISVFPQYSYALKGWAVGNESFSGLWLGIYLFLFAVHFVTLPQKNSDASDEVTGIVSVGFVLYALMGVLKSVLWFIHRMQVYFIFGFCMIIPEILFNLRATPRLKQSLSIVFKLGLAIWAILMFIQDGHGILPYKFIWESLF